jgi:hypothetical protein
METDAGSSSKQAQAQKIKEGLLTKAFFVTSNTAWLSGKRLTSWLLFQNPHEHLHLISNDQAKYWCQRNFNWWNADV